MRVIRKILVVLFSILLTGMLIGMVLTFPLKKVISHNFIGGIVKQQIAEEFSEAFSVDLEKMKQAIQDERVSQFIDKYVDLTIEGISDKEAVEELEIGQDLKKLFQENKEVLMQELNITESELNELLNSADFERVSEEYRSSVLDFDQELDSDQKKLFTFYNFVSTLSYQLFLVGIIIGVIVLIALIQWSLVRWMIPVGVSCIVAGILGTGLAYLMQLLFQYALADLMSNVLVHMGPMYCYSIGVLVIGILCVILYCVLKDRLKKQEIVS